MANELVHKNKKTNVFALTSVWWYQKIPFLKSVLKQIQALGKMLNTGFGENVKPYLADKGYIGNNGITWNNYIKTFRMLRS